MNRNNSSRIRIATACIAAVISMTGCGILGGGVSPGQSTSAASPSSSVAKQRQVVYNQTPSVGAIVKFGAYEQDNNLDNGPEPIEWIVLDKYDDGKYCLMSVYGLDQVDYDEKINITAKDSHIYSWMNNDFLNAAFVKEEQSFMSDYLYQPAGSSKPLITSKVILLDPSQMKNYLKSNAARMAKATKYAEAKGAQIEGGHCWYWLQPAVEKGSLVDTHTACVNYDGSVMERISINKSTRGAVRPVIIVDLQAMIR